MTKQFLPATLLLPCHGLNKQKPSQHLAYQTWNEIKFISDTVCDNLTDQLKFVFINFVGKIMNSSARRLIGTD
jgi:hypothetical protein